MLSISENNWKKYIEELDSTIFKSYNSIMHGYALMPANVVEDLENVAKYGRKL